MIKTIQTRKRRTWKSFQSWQGGFKMRKARREWIWSGKDDVKNSNNFSKSIILFHVRSFKLKLSCRVGRVLSLCTFLLFSAFSPFIVFLFFIFSAQSTIDGDFTCNQMKQETLFCNLFAFQSVTAGFLSPKNFVLFNINLTLYWEISLIKFFSFSNPAASNVEAHSRALLSSSNFRFQITSKTGTNQFKRQ